MRVELGSVLPRAIKDAPQIGPGLGLYWQAFWDLCDERRGENALIPWSARQRYAEVMGLDDECTDALHHHIRLLDVAFLEWKDEKNRRGKGKTRPSRDEDEPDGDPAPVRKKDARFGRQGERASKPR